MANHGSEERTAASGKAAAGQGRGEAAADRAARRRQRAADRTTAATKAEAAAGAGLDDELHGLDFTVCVSLRYHAKRRAWFERWHNLAMVAAIGSATAAVATVADQYPQTSTWIAVMLALLTASDLAFGFNRRSRAYGDLYQRFSTLAAAIRSKGSPTAADVRRWTAERLRIEADEPDILNTLNALCHNEEAQARGHDETKLVALNWLDRRLAHWFDLRAHYPLIGDRAAAA